jgi:hypothetical protein
LVGKVPYPRHRTTGLSIVPTPLAKGRHHFKNLARRNQMLLALGFLKGRPGVSAQYKGKKTSSHHFEARFKEGL